MAAEGLGTALLLAAIIGSGIMAERLSGGNVALALLCNTVATGAILTVLIAVFGQVSGAHFNPAVTLVFLLRGEIAAGLAIGYIIMQVAGGILGTLTAHLMFAETLLQLSTKARSGSSFYFSEAVATFGLILTILGTSRWRKEAVGAMVGLYIASAYWFTASTSFANPAVTVARSLTDSFAGIEPAAVPGFILAQSTGALCAAALAAWLFATRTRPA